MPRRSAAARTSAAWAASCLGTPKWRNTWLLKSRNASMGKSLVSTSGMFRLPFSRLRRKGLPASFSAKWDEEQANRKCDRRQRDGDSQRSKVLNARADEKGDRGSAKTREGRGKGKSARAAFGWILFGEPKRVNGKIRAAKSKKEKTNEKPGQGRRSEIEDFSEGERNESRHQREEKCQSATPPKFLSEPGHRQAPENGGKRNEHGGARRELRR